VLTTSRGDLTSRPITLVKAVVASTEEALLRFEYLVKAVKTENAVGESRAGSSIF